MSPDLVEDDDYLHNPDARTKKKGDAFTFTRRAFENVGCMVILMTGLIGLLCAILRFTLPAASSFPVVPATRSLLISHKRSFRHSADSTLVARMLLVKYVPPE